KIFWSSGGQICPPHDRSVIERAGQVDSIVRMPFGQAQAMGSIVCPQAEMDACYQAGVLSHARSGPRRLKIVYSPLHGVGLTSVLPVLRAAGFDETEVYAPHATCDPDFTTLPGRIPNPERPEVFDALVDWANEIGAELV